MLNDRDEKYEGHDEGEYHFSDEEVSYEVESDVQKSPTVEGSKINLLANLTRSKRMLISLGVFFGLVFIVYKMVSPNTANMAQPTDITAPPTIATRQNVAPASLVPTTPPPAQQVAPTSPIPTAAQPAASTVSLLPTNMPPSAEAAVRQPLQPPVQSPPIATAPGAPAVTSILPANTTMPPQPSAEPMVAPVAPQTGPQSATAVAGAGLPSTLPPGILPDALSQPATDLGQVAAPGSATIDTKIYDMASSSQKLITQMQTDYAKKLNDYETRNKALQDQLQTLNSRVGSMETQLNQLIQVLIRQNQSQNPGQTSGQYPGGATNDVGPMPAQVQPVAVINEPKSNYNVQAIIPGRAWLKSTGGETLTVAEGDMIRDFGRVTKIDPYNGVIEVNTGSRMVSLSYGNGS